MIATQEKALELARGSVAMAQVLYENGVITSAELNDAQVRLLQTEWLLMQAKCGEIRAHHRGGGRQGGRRAVMTTADSTPIRHRTMNVLRCVSASLN